MISTTNPLRYYFAGLSVHIYEYVHIDANVIQDSTALCLRYQPLNFSIYCPVKNHIIVCDMLTGCISNTLRNQSVGEISAFDILDDFNLGIIGDS